MAHRTLGRTRRSQSGQSVVELIIALLGFLTVLFMYVQVALSFGVANYIHYVTFMAARAYESGAESQLQQQKAAESVFNKMVMTADGNPRFASIITPTGGNNEITGVTIGKGPDINPQGPIRSNFWQQGAAFTFSARLYMLPLITGPSGKGSKIDLESQSWLGREPTQQECINFMTISGPPKSGIKNPFLYDNGC